MTKPFTPEEITQAVHRFASQGRTTSEEVMSANEESASLTPPAPSTPFRFWHDVWSQPTPKSTFRCGAVLGGLQAGQIESVRLPKMGEVVYQGLPLASVTTRDGQQRTICSPLTGVVETVNSQLATEPGTLATNPCGAGWLAEIHATRDEVELKNCISRNMLIMTANAEVAEDHMERLHRLGCTTRGYIGLGLGRGWDDMAGRLATEHDDVVLMDAATLGIEGPKMVARINVLAPSTRIVVVASPACPWEAAYRAQRIFYYVVEPFDDQEMVEVLNSAFAMPVVRRGRASRSATMESVAEIHITNRQGDDVALLAAPGMLFRNAGLGAEIRGLIYDRLYPIQTVPGKASIAPRDILNMAHKCDHVVVLESKDMGCLPGMLIRDQGLELAALGSDGLSEVTALNVQPPGDSPCVDALDSRTIAQLARHIVEVIAGA